MSGSQTRRGLASFGILSGLENKNADCRGQSAAAKQQSKVFQVPPAIPDQPGCFCILAFLRTEELKNKNAESPVNPDFLPAEDDCILPMDTRNILQSNNFHVK